MQVSSIIFCSLCSLCTVSLYHLCLDCRWSFSPICLYHAISSLSPLVICLRRIRALHYIGCRAYSFARFLLRAETVPSPELPTIQFPTEHSDNTLPSSPSQTDDLPLSECQDAAATTTPEGSLVQKTKKWDNVLIYLSIHSFPSSLTIPNDYYHFIGLSPCDQRKAGIALEREREREKKKNNSA